MVSRLEYLLNSDWLEVCGRRLGLVHICVKGIKRIVLDGDEVQSIGWSVELKLKVGLVGEKD